MNINIPTLFTLLRLFIIPLIVMIHFSEIHYANWIATFLFIIGGISDAIDGYLARRWNQSTQLGEFLDPVADKLLVVVMLILIATDPYILAHVHYTALFVLAIISIVAREIIISALREWMAQVGRRNAVAVSHLGKYKTGFQMTAIGFFLFKYNLLFIPVLPIGEILLYIAALLSLWSVGGYLCSAYKIMQSES